MLKIKKLMVGLLIAVLLTLVLLAVLSFAVVKMGTLPAAFAGTLAMAAGATGVLLASMLTAHLVGEKGLVHGLVLSGTYTVIYMFAVWICSHDIRISVLLVRVVIFALCGALGGIIGVSGKNKIQF